MVKVSILIFVEMIVDLCYLLKLNFLSDLISSIFVCHDAQSKKMVDNEVEFTNELSNNEDMYNQRFNVVSV